MIGGHTPGNWYANGSNVFVPVHGDNGPAIIIARFAGEGAETEANAAVAAAAPELFQAVMACWALLESDDRYADSECKELANAAIRKATGQ